MNLSHEQARALLAAQFAGELAASDQRRLEQHLASCPACSDYAGSLDRMVRELRAVPVAVSAEVVAATRRRVRMRAYEMRQRDRRLRPLWLAAALSWLWIAASLPFFWRAFAWAGESLGLAGAVWQSAFVLWWLLPGTVAAAILVARSRRPAPLVMTDDDAARLET